MSPLSLRPRVRTISHLALIVILACSAVPSFQAAAVGLKAEKIARSVTIYRDAYGVPHVYGPTDASCVFGFAYAQAEDNFWQIEDSYIRALGRASEVYGESALNADLLNRALEIPKLAMAEYNNSKGRARELSDALADGFNYFLERNPQVKPRLLTRFEPWHAFAFRRFSLYQLFIFGKTGLKLDEIRTAARESQTDAAGTGTISARIADITDSSEAALEPVVGSNMWAVTPAKSATGHAMLFINPHQPLFGSGQWYEGHLHSEEGWNISGASFFGSPFPTLGHNEYLGWSHTVNDPDITDVYVENFDDPKDALAYRYGSGYRKASEWTEVIKIKGAGGLTSKTFKLRKTHHGPIVAVREGKPLALRMSRIEDGGALEEWYEMSKARNMAEFKAAMSRVSIPMFNTMYADREGNIFYVYNGAIPRRSTGFDWKKPVDGSNPKTDWQGYHSFEELPQITNPKTNFLQNCNQTPFTTTTEGNPAKESFPEYMVREPDNARARISRRILSSKEKFTFDEWARAGFDTSIIEAETYIPLLAGEVDKLKNTDAARAAKLADPIAEMKAWNGVSTIDSKGMTLFALWFERLGRMRAAAPKDELVNIRALEEAISELERDWGTWRVAWGDLNRLQRRHTGGEQPFSDSDPSLPIAGAPGWLGVVFNFYARPEKGQKRRYGVVGHSFVSVVEFGPKVRARSVLAFGQSADSNSLHYFDQAQLYAKHQFKPAWFTLQDVKANSKRVYHPGQQALRKGA